MSGQPARPWLILAGLCLGVCVTNSFARFAYGLLLPAMRTELNWSYAQAGWLNTANALGYLAGAILTMVLIRRVRPARLYAVGLISTALALMATGLSAEMGWQTALRITAGIVGAMSFSTAGALAARLFPGDARRTALGIAIVFGTGGGLGIVLAGATLPPLLELYGSAAWPWGWIIIGAMSLAALPLGLWAAFQLPTPPEQAVVQSKVPVRAMIPEIFGYAAFGMGYIVYLTFLAAWMRAQDVSGLMIAAVWMLMGICITLSPFVWRGIFARSATGLPLALVLFCIAAGTALPVLMPVLPALLVSAVVFGLSVFMAPGAVTNFARQNLPLADVGSAVAIYTVGFAAAQILGPLAAGLLGDATGDIGSGLLGAAAVLSLGGLVALTQRSLPPRT